MEKLKAVRAGNRIVVTRLLQKFDKTFETKDLLFTNNNLKEKTKSLEKLNRQILGENGNRRQ